MRRFGIPLAVIVVVGLATGASAAPPPGGLIYAQDIYDGGEGIVAVRPDGSGWSPTCPGEVTGVGASRRFLQARTGGTLLWSGNDCVSHVLYEEAGIGGDWAEWSPDGLRVAFAISWTEYDKDGNPFRVGGVRVGEVVDRAGVLSVENVVLAVRFPPGDVGQLSFANDGTVAFVRQMPVGTARGTSGDVYVASGSDGDLGAVNITNSPDDEFYPSLTPDGTRVAFGRTVISNGVTRADIFTAPASGGRSVRVTSKANTPATSNLQPQWSPDATHIAFACKQHAGQAVVHVCRIDKAGSSKAVDLTPKSSAYFSVTGWRQ